MKKQYVTVGTETISSNIFRKILRPLNNYTFKPTGGLWASEFNKYMVSDWYEYIIYSVQNDNTGGIVRKEIFSGKSEAVLGYVKGFLDATFLYASNVS